MFFAFIGFDSVSSAAEEVKNPKRDLPIGIIGSLAVCAVLYVAVSAVVTGIVPWQDFAGIPNPVSFALKVVEITSPGRNSRSTRTANSPHAMSNWRSSRRAPRKRAAHCRQKRSRSCIACARWICSRHRASRKPSTDAGRSRSCRYRSSIRNPCRTRSACCSSIRTISRAWMPIRSRNVSRRWRERNDHGHFARNVVHFVRLLRGAGLGMSPAHAVDALDSLRLSTSAGVMTCARRSPACWSTRTTNAIFLMPSSTCSGAIPTGKASCARCCQGSRTACRRPNTTTVSPTRSPRAPI